MEHQLGVSWRLRVKPAEVLPNRFFWLRLCEFIESEVSLIVDQVFYFCLSAEALIVQHIKVSALAEACRTTTSSLHKKRISLSLSRSHTQHWPCTCLRVSARVLIMTQSLYHHYILLPLLLFPFFPSISHLVLSLSCWNVQQHPDSTWISLRFINTQGSWAESVKHVLHALRYKSFIRGR